MTSRLSWTPSGGEQGFEIERSSSANPDWQVVANVAANTTSFNLTNLANDTYSFRVRGIHAGQIGKFVTNAGNVVSVVVEQRSKIDITSLVSYPISNISLVGGVWQQDLNLINDSAQAYVPFVDFNVIAVNSASGTVRVINSDNGGSGKGSANAALFSFSQKLGDDQLFSPAETTATRTLRFQDSAAEMFSWDVQVTAYVGTGASSNSSSSSSSGNTQPPPASGGREWAPAADQTHRRDALHSQPVNQDRHKATYQVAVTARFRGPGSLGCPVLSVCCKADLEEKIWDVQKLQIQKRFSMTRKMKFVLTTWTRSLAMGGGDRHVDFDVRNRLFYVDLSAALHYCRCFRKTEATPSHSIETIR